MFKARKDKEGYAKRAQQFADELRNGLSQEDKREMEKAKNIMRKIFC